MQTIGIIGGVSWESSAVYSNWLNELVRGRCPIVRNRQHRSGEV